jgi:hypothetical protein
MFVLASPCGMTGKAGGDVPAQQKNLHLRAGGSLSLLHCKLISRWYGNTLWMVTHCKKGSAFVAILVTYHNLSFYILAAAVIAGTSGVGHNNVAKG